MAIKDVLFPPPTVAATQPTTAPTSQPSASEKLDALLARHAGGRTAGEQLGFLQHSFDAQMGQLDQRERQVEDLQRLVTAAQAQLKVDRAQLDSDRAKLSADQDESARLASDQGFQDSLNLYNSMPARQVKGIFMAMDEETAVKYLRAMQPRTAAKIMKEFKTPDEADRLKKLMQRMAPTPPSTAPVKEP